MMLPQTRLHTYTLYMPGFHLQDCNYFQQLIAYPVPMAVEDYSCSFHNITESFVSKFQADHQHACEQVCRLQRNPARHQIYEGYPEIILFLSLLNPSFSDLNVQKQQKWQLQKWYRRNILSLILEIKSVRASLAMCFWCVTLANSLDLFSVLLLLQRKGIHISLVQKIVRMFGGFFSMNKKSDTTYSPIRKP